jgi:hypothetical protein
MVGSGKKRKKFGVLIEPTADRKKWAAEGTRAARLLSLTTSFFQSAPLMAPLNPHRPHTRTPTATHAHQHVDALLGPSLPVWPGGPF